MDKSKMIALAVAAGGLYLAYSGKIKNGTVKTAVTAVSAVVAARQVPVVNQYV